MNRRSRLGGGAGAVACAVLATGAWGQSVPPPGMWTVIVHGRTGSCSYPSNYNDLTSASGWMRQLAARVESLGPGTISIYTMNAATLALTTVNAASGGTNPLDPSKHHVLLFDWGATSDYDSLLCASPGGGDRNGYAFAAGDSLDAILRHWNAEVFALIGFSRGAVVVSEASRRMMVGGINPGQVVFLDGEGCQSGGGSGCNLYADGLFDAWAPVAGTVRFDNLFEAVNEHYLAPSVCSTDLGGHAKPRCRGLSVGTAYAHTVWSFTSSCLPSYSQHSIIEYLVTGLRVENGRYEYPAATGAVQDPNPLGAGVNPLPNPFNGDLAFASLAGWTGNGGGGTGTTSSLAGQATLHLSRGQAQAHNYLLLPSCPGILQLSAAADGTTPGDSALSIIVRAPGLADQEIGPVPVSQLTPSLTPFQFQIPAAFLGRVGTIRVAESGTTGTAGVHLAAISFSSCAGYCYANCDASSAVPILNANDFQCFLNEFASGHTNANCDGSSAAPILNANDFQCFLNAFAMGCS